MKPLVRMEGVQVERVNELFLPGTGTWNEQLVAASFVPYEAEEILKIRPGLHVQEDMVAWADERNGWYSVCLCYRRLKEEQDQREAMKESTASASENSRWWAAIWHLNVAPKVRIFWWHALHKFLPTKGELKRRYIEHEDHCEVCGVGNLVNLCIKWQCTYACEFWKVMKESTGFKLPLLHPVSWTRELLSGDLCATSESALIICGAWSLWTGRNARRHGKITQT
jgi:hypothetical protein